MGMDPFLQYTPSGLPVVSVSLACKGGKKDETTWLDVKAFGKTAENLAQWGKKGNSLAMWGSYKIDSYNDADGGKKKYHYMLADSFEFLPVSSKSKGSAPEPSEKTEAPSDWGSDLPF